MKHGFRQALVLILLMALLTALPGAAALASQPEEAQAVEYPAFGSDEELAEVMEAIDKEFGAVDVGVAVCFTGTGECLYYNADEWFVTASLYKLPMLMAICRAEANGESERFDTIFEDTDLAKHEVLVYSNNTYALGWRAVFGEGELLERELELTGYEPDPTEMIYLRSGQYSPRYYLRILQELYNNPDRYPHLLEYMEEAQPEEYLRHFLEGQYRIAQKYGSVDFYNHIGGVVYSDPPVLVVIMTVGCGASGGETRIGVTGQRIMEYVETVNQRWRDYVAAQEAAAATPEPTPEPTPEATPEPTAEPTSAPTAVPTEAPAEASAAPVPTDAPAKAAPSAVQLALPAAFALLAILILAAVLVRRFRH